MECRKFLERLAPWQIEAIRNVQLGITECEIRGLGMRGASEAFARVCEMLGTGLRSLTLDVQPQAVVWRNAPRCPEEPRNATWVTDGLVRLKSLKMLHLQIFHQSVIATSDGEEDGMEVCKRALSAKLPWCGRVVVCLQKDMSNGSKACDACAC